MSNVVTFRPDRRTRFVTHEREATGRILLFMGVRYVRDDVDAAASGPRPASPVTPTERLLA